MELVQLSSLEQSGTSSKHIQLFIQSAAKHWHELSGGALPASAILQRWRQKFSMTLQKVLSVTTAKVFVSVREVLDRPRPEPLRFQTVHLVKWPRVLEDH